MMDELIEKYVKLRDKKAEMKAEFDAKVAKFDEAMTKIENVILKKLNEDGADSYGTAAGTAFRQSVTSATVADRDMFLNYLKETDNWSLADVRCSKTSVKEFRDANDDLPPGINWREEQVVRIRRA